MQDIIQFSGNHFILVLTWFFLLILMIVTIINRIFSKVKIISRDEAIHLINKKDAVLVDVRDRDDYRKGHILNAINVLVEDIRKGNIGELKKHKTKPVIVVCTTGASASGCAAQLNASNFEQVYVLKDGVSGWSGENLPLVRGK